MIIFNGCEPINQSRSFIGYGHPIGAFGAKMFHDLYIQETRIVGKYLVEIVRNSMILNTACSATTNYVFVVGR